MNPAPRVVLDDLAGSLARLADQADAALGTACREVFQVNDELDRYAASALAAANAEPDHELLLRRLQHQLRQTSDEFQDQARRLLRLIDDRIPVARAFLHQVALLERPQPSPSDSPAAPAAAIAPPARTPTRPAQRVPVAPSPTSLPPLPAPAAPPAGSLPAAPMLASASPIRRAVPSTADDLRRAWQGVQHAWREARVFCQEGDRAVFERDHRQPIDQELAATLQQMEQLADVVVHVIRELA